MNWITLGKSVEHTNIQHDKGNIQVFIAPNFIDLCYF